MRAKSMVCVLAVLMAVLPPALAAGGDGAAWKIDEFTFSARRVGPSIVMVDGDDVWVAMAIAGRIARFRDGAFREFDLPPGSFPVGIAIDAAKQVWYSDIRRNLIGRLDPRDGSVREFAVPTKDSWPFFPVVDKYQRIWFTERIGNRIGMLDPSTGVVREYDVPTKHAQPAGMAVTPFGEVFFTENSGGRVGRIDVESGAITEIAVPSPLNPSPFYGLAGIASDSRGNVWFAIVEGRLGLIRRGSSRIEEIAVPNRAARPAGVVVDRWDRVWFTELDGNAISSYDPPSGVFRTYPIPTGAPDPRPMGPPEATARGELPVPGLAARTSRPFGIAADRHGQIWFSEQYAHKLGRLAPPMIDVVEPNRPVSAARSSLRAIVRLDEPGTLAATIDDRPVDGETIDAWSLGPGRHELRVRVTARDGQAWETTTAFRVTPTLDSIAEALRGQPRTLARIEEMKTLARAGDTPRARALEHELLLELHRKPSRSPDEELLLAHLRHHDLFAGRSYEVSLAGGFTPKRMIIEAGDAVRWQAGDSTHHVVVDGISAATPVTRRFPREGTFAVACADHPREQGTVEVRARRALMLEIPMLGPDRVPSVLTTDKDGNVWFTAGGGGFLSLAAIPLNNRIGRVDREGRVTEFQTPTLESAPTSIHGAADGRIWFTERGGNNLAVLDPSTGAVREYPLPTPMSAATGITVAGDGRVWYAAKLASKVGVLDPVTGVIRELDTPTPKSLPSTITAAADGSIWFDERANDRIVRLDPATGAMREYTVPTRGSRVVGLVPDGKGHMWFLELGANKVGRLDIASGAVVEYAIPTSYSSPFKLAIDPLGRVWFTQVFGNKVAMLDGRRFFEFALPADDALPGGIAIDDRGNVWIAQQAGNRLGVLPGAGLIAHDQGEADEL